MKNEIKYLFIKVRFYQPFFVHHDPCLQKGHTKEEDYAFINAKSHISQRPSLIITLLRNNSLCNSLVICANNKTQSSLNKHFTLKGTNIRSLYTSKMHEKELFYVTQ